MAAPSSMGHASTMATAISMAAMEVVTPIRGLSQPHTTTIADGGSSIHKPHRHPGFETSPRVTGPLYDAIFGTQGYAASRRYQPDGMSGPQVSWPMTQPAVPLTQLGRQRFERGSSSSHTLQPFGFEQFGVVPPGLGILSNQPGIASTTAAIGVHQSSLHGAVPSMGVQDPILPNLGVGNSFLLTNIWNVSPTNFVTTKLTKVEDFLSWRTQFVGLLIVHQVQGSIDNSVRPFRRLFVMYMVKLLITLNIICFCDMINAFECGCLLLFPKMMLLILVILLIRRKSGIVLILDLTPIVRLGHVN